MSKTLLCPCEDVTTDDVDHAISKGYCDVESVKRYTGFGTGMCQGKQCLASVAAVLQTKGKLGGAQLVPFTPRPPLFPTELSLWASAGFDPAESVTGGVPAALGLSQHALRPEGPVPQKAKIVIIGGGIMGLALAHNLALQGETDVVVLEKGYLCAGASGRNGGGVRMQWGTATNIELSKRSIHLMKGFAREMGINVWLRQGGYLFLAKSKAVAERLARSATLHNKHGVPTEILTPDAAQQIVPQLEMTGVQLAAFNKDDGVIFPWPFMWGYAQSCQKKGIKVETFTRVTGFEQAQGRIRKVITDRGEIACDTVVVACGAWSPKIASLAGVKLPNEPHRHEICSSEPLKPFLQPLVSVLDSGLYFSQSMRGEIVGGMGDPAEKPQLELGSSMRFLSRYGKALTELMPSTGRLKILRQWAGPYDVTPDNSPILGRTPGLPNLLQLSGFVGHGFMMAPVVGELYGEYLTGGAKHELFEQASIMRFRGGPSAYAKEDFNLG